MLTSGDEMQAVLDRGVADSDVVGAVAQVVSSDSTIASAAAGFCSLDDPAGPMTPDTVCRIASMTKPITGVAAMQLVERGELDLDMAAAIVLPEIADAGVLEGFDDNGEPVVRPAKGTMTLRHLLTHTSGFGYAYWSKPLLRYQRVTGTEAMSSGELAAKMAVPALFDPGERWAYGLSTDFVGRIVEVISSQRLDAYFAEHILGPLGMDSTSFVLDAAMESRLSALHMRTLDGPLATLDLGPIRAPAHLSGGGGLFSTANDYSRFLQMILGRGTCNGVQVLRPETVEQMVVNHIGDLQVVPLRTAMPEQTHDLEFFGDTRKTWGLSFMINEGPLPTGRPAGGLMWAGIANTYFWIDMHNGVAGTYLSQQLPFGDPRTLQLFTDVEAATYRHLA